MTEIEYVDGLIRELKKMKEKEEYEYCTRIFEKICTHKLTPAQVKKIKSLMQ